MFASLLSWSRVTSASLLSMQPHLLFDCCIVVNVPSCAPPLPLIAPPPLFPTTHCRLLSTHRHLLLSNPGARGLSLHWCLPSASASTSHYATVSCQPPPPPSASCLSLVVPSRPSRTFTFRGAKLATEAGSRVFYNWVLFVESCLECKGRHNLNRVNFW